MLAKLRVHQKKYLKNGNLKNQNSLISFFAETQNLYLDGLSFERNWKQGPML